MTGFEIKMPKMGESVQEATIIKWFKKVGDIVKEEDILLEIGTDKVDSEIPSPVEGKIIEILYKEESVVPVGNVIAIIDMEGNADDSGTAAKKQADAVEQVSEKTGDKKTEEIATETYSDQKKAVSSGTDKFYSPLVQNIARINNVSLADLEQINGSGTNGRVRKQDIIHYIESNKIGNKGITGKEKTPVSISVSSGDQVIKMDRLRKMIADNMILSKQISAHVTNFIEVDVTNLVKWREKIKDGFEKQEKQKLSFMPMFIEATAKCLKIYPGINASVDKDTIILRKNINIGVAVALPSNNLIVPVIKNADQKSLVGLTTDLNILANNARNNKLGPDDIHGGTFTISNFGTFKNLTGTPIINQPQVAILATGTIEKKPAILETPTGDVIAIRHKMILALTYDHRVVDGALAGMFLKSLADYLENFDINRTI